MYIVDGHEDLRDISVWRGNAEDGKLDIVYRLLYSASITCQTRFSPSLDILPAVN